MTAGHLVGGIEATGAGNVIVHGIPSSIVCVIECVSFFHLGSNHQLNRLWKHTYPWPLYSGSILIVIPSHACFLISLIIALNNGFNVHRGGFEGPGRHQFNNFILNCSMETLNSVGVEYFESKCMSEIARRMPTSINLASNFAATSDSCTQSDSVL
jgi:hypothetical protein